jgi:hypothetical protein
MTTKQVDISNLKKEIISYMSTGYDGDKKVCIDILDLVDQNTKPKPDWLSQALNEGDGVYRP